MGAPKHPAKRRIRIQMSLVFVSVSLVAQSTIMRIQNTAKSALTKRRISSQPPRPTLQVEARESWRDCIQSTKGPRCPQAIFLAPEKLSFSHQNCFATLCRVRMRLDQALVDRGLCESREKAKRAIMAGSVRVNGQIAAKASDTVKEGDALELTMGDKFVSRGGHKLEHALIEFALDVKDVIAIDLGASTGGFTDCLLQHGAAKVFAVDVGQGQFAWKLRHDARVIVMEKTNARTLTAAHFTQLFSPVDLVVIDCSFISLRKVLPPAIALLKPLGKVVALIKPQFEAGKEEADRGEGVISDPVVHARVLRELESFVAAMDGVRWSALTESPLRGPAGNKEFLVLLEKIA